MKFTDGYWLTRENFTIQSPKVVYDYKIMGDTLTVYAPYKVIRRRGDTLNLGLTTVVITSPHPDVIGVKLIHHDVREDGPIFPITTSPTSVNISEDDEKLSFASGKLSVCFPKTGPFRMDFYSNGILLTSSLPNAQAQIESTDGQTYMREQLSLGIDEKIYGLGERFTPFIKNGQDVEIWNRDGGTGSEQAYKNIPFYLSSEGYGVFTRYCGKVSYEIASENVSRVQFSVPGEVLEYYIIGGENAKQVIENYTDLTGKPALPPSWSFGLWLSTSFSTDYSEETVMQFIDGMQERNIPFDVFHFDCFWMKAFEWCGFEWDPERFPDPKGMISRIKDKGLKVCVWINPYIAQKTPLFEEGKEKGYFLKRADGNVWQWDLWQAGQGIVDFTNPEAVVWYSSHLEKLLDMGVDSFKTDFGERIPEDAVYFDHSNPEKAHNYYAQLYNQTVFDVLLKKRGKNEAVVFARSATAGGQQFPVHWGGDNLSIYPSMAESLRGGLSFLLSGFGFWSHDIGGFEEQASPDIYKRWTQFGLLSSHSRYHGNVQYRVPWLFDEEAVEVTREFSALKVSLMPYLWKEAVQTSQTGVSLMRPVFMEFENDPNTFYLDKEYMLGENLLVAPIFTENGNVRYYLPEGKWTHLLSSASYEVGENGKWITETYDYHSLPLFVRENTILVQGEARSSASYDYTDSVKIHLYELQEGESITKLYAHDGTVAGEITVTRTGNQYTVKQNGLSGKCQVFVHVNGEEKSYSLEEGQTTISLGE